MNKTKQSKYDWKNYWNDELRRNIVYGIAMVIGFLTFSIFLFTEDSTIRWISGGILLTPIISFVVYAMWPDKIE